MARAVKDRHGKLCISVGNYRDPAVAERVLAQGDADLIGIGRGLIADPNWVRKVWYGREDEIRKCISCNIGCAGNRISSNIPIRCTVNPDVVGGDAYRKRQVSKPCNVVVVGGGTAGLEAACTAAEVGCNVFLLEEKEELGGLSVVISKIPEKRRLADFPRYLVQRAAKLKNLYVFTQTRATADSIAKFHPDIIVNATGSKPLLPPIAGLHEHIDRPGGAVKSIQGMIDSLEEFPDDATGKNVVVVGGGAVGLDVVEFFANRGASCSIVEMLPTIGNGLDPVSKVAFNTMMDEHDVKRLANTALTEVRADRFLVRDEQGEFELPFDYGFVCLGMKAFNPVLEELERAYADDNSAKIVNIGDSNRARRIIEGTEEGRNVLMALEKRGFLSLRIGETHTSGHAPRTRIENGGFRGAAALRGWRDSFPKRPRACHAPNAAVPAPPRRDGGAAAGAHPAMRQASFMLWAYAATCGAALRPCSATMRTMADPTMTPSATAAMSRACSGVDMPKPTAHGTSGAASFARRTMAPTSVAMDERTPVTPSDDTQYRKPSASRAIMATRSSDVGATSEISSMPCARQGRANSSFSSKGTSGRMSPCAPASRARAAKRSMP